ncbi:hypothetical protein CFRS1_v013374 [Colletotrichum fructicola]|nr:hypothetical protein CFRS1_v013374 [Colletotrichum fructicola]
MPDRTIANDLPKSLQWNATNECTVPCLGQWTTGTPKDRVKVSFAKGDTLRNSKYEQKNGTIEALMLRLCLGARARENLRNMAEIRLCVDMLLLWPRWDTRSFRPLCQLQVPPMRSL